MCGIASEHRPPHTKSVGYPLVHAIDRAVGHLVCRRLGDHTLQSPLGAFVAERLIVGLVVGHWEKGSPKIDGAQEHHPFVGIGDIVDVGEIGHVVGQFIGRRDHEVAVGVGHAIERATERLSHSARGTVGPDDSIGLDCLAVGQYSGSTLGPLFDSPDGRTEAHIDQRVRRKLFEKDLAQLELFALKAKRVVRDVTQFAEVESGHDSDATISIGEVLGDEAAGDHLVDDAVRPEQFEGRGMKRGGPQLARE